MTRTEITTIIMLTTMIIIPHATFGNKNLVVLEPLKFAISGLAVYLCSHRSIICMFDPVVYVLEMKTAKL